MKIDTENIYSISEANKNFSHIAKEVDKAGSVVIIKNNKPKYVISKIDDGINLSEEEKIEVVARRILREHKRAFEVLAR